MRFVVKFDSSVIYHFSNSTDQSDINKLYGFTDCGSLIHENSAIFGWRWWDNSLQILAYCYVYGNVEKKFITQVKIGQEVSCMIKACDGYYLFRVNDLPFDTLKRGCGCNGLKFICYPYFGGDKNAPHDIRVRIKDL